MSYMDEVYFKRLNKDGTNRQDRIKSRKEKEFDRLFLRDTEYLVNLYRINGEEVSIRGSLQPNKWNESNLIGNLLISTSVAPFKTGDLLEDVFPCRDASRLLTGTTVASARLALPLAAEVS